MSTPIKKRTQDYLMLTKHACLVLEEVLPPADKEQLTASDLILRDLHRSLHNLSFTNTASAESVTSAKLREAVEVVRSLYTDYDCNLSFNVTLKGLAAVVHDVASIDHAILIAKLEAISYNQPYDLVGVTDVSCVDSLLCAVN